MDVNNYITTHRDIRNKLFNLSDDNSQSKVIMLGNNEFIGNGIEIEQPKHFTQKPMDPAYGGTVVAEKGNKSHFLTDTDGDVNVFINVAVGLENTTNAFSSGIDIAEEEIFSARSFVASDRMKNNVLSAENDSAKDPSFCIENYESTSNSDDPLAFRCNGAVSEGNCNIPQSMSNQSTVTEDVIQFQKELGMTEEKTCHKGGHNKSKKCWKN